MAREYELVVSAEFLDNTANFGSQGNELTAARLLYESVVSCSSSSSRTQPPMDNTYAIHATIRVKCGPLEILCLSDFAVMYQPAKISCIPVYRGAA